MNVTTDSINTTDYESEAVGISNDPYKAIQMCDKLIYEEVYGDGHIEKIHRQIQKERESMNIVRHVCR